ncbi:cytochrome P450 [Kibdelosporangium aridum]|uniref:Cytochrome P450 n=1 Tax=Kibdelosporangium aridum TaxID=2030 RepID=A0A428Z579_KIBAR|nr:cytochrome P450 [Kibdelosporangium aridum]RSM81964.1 cytochrome P450 [Kibdelosporangium aridum]
MTTSDSKPDPFALLQEPSVRADPYPLYHLLREQCPILIEDGPLALVGSYEHSQQVLRDPAMSSRLQDLMPGVGRPDTDPPFLLLDPPDHTRLRGLVSQAFTPRAIAVLAPRITEIVENALAEAAERGSIDIVADLAYPLPVTIISEWLGVPTSDGESLREWSQLLTRTFDLNVGSDERDEIARAAKDFDEYFRDLIAFRRRTPGDDLLSQLISVEERGDRLTSAELLATVGLLLVAGHETTTNLISNGLLALLRHPDELARLRADPGLTDAAVEESLRYDPSVQLVGRVTKEPTTVGTLPVPANTWTILLIGAANRDPARYPEPDRFRLDRDSVPHLAFSYGPHFCIGSSLARLEAGIAFRTFASTVVNPELDADTLSYRRHVNFRGPDRMIVSFDAAR